MFSQGSLTIDHSTVTEYQEQGIRFIRGEGQVDSCILWGAAGDGLDIDASMEVEVRHSLVRSVRTWPGEGNGNDLPRFCRWTDTEPVSVSNSEELNELLLQTERTYALDGNSPAWTMGPGGGRIGADLGSCTWIGRWLPGH